MIEYLNIMQTQYYQNNRIPRHTLLGQCYFTFEVLNNLLNNNLAPECVLIEQSEVDHDPFKGLVIEKQVWFDEHKLYHRDWLGCIEDLCHRYSIRLEVGSDVIDKLEILDVLVVAGYANKVPSGILKEYKGWAINIHPSILPMFKGPQPEAHMILSDNYGYAGVTIHEMTEAWDSGRIYWLKNLKTNNSLTVGQMEAAEATLACLGIKRLFQKYPVIEFCNSHSIQDESYQSWYDIDILKIDKNSIINESCFRLFKLRPEGYAQLYTNNGVLYPIFDFSRKRIAEYLECISGGVLKSNNKIKYLGKNETANLIKKELHL